MLSVLQCLRDVANWCKKFDDTGWITATGNYGNPVSYRRKNGYVHFSSSQGSKNLTKGQYVTVFTLPVGFRPAKGCQLATDGVGAYTRSIVGYINASGEVKIYSSDGSIYFNAWGCFPLD